MFIRHSHYSANPAMASKVKLAASLRPTPMKRNGIPEQSHNARKCADCDVKFRTFSDRKKYCFYCQQAFCRLCLSTISRNVYADEDSTPFEREVQACENCKKISAPDSERSDLMRINLVDLISFVKGLSIQATFQSKEELVDFIIDIIKRARVYTPQAATKLVDQVIARARASAVTPQPVRQSSDRTAPSGPSAPPAPTAPVTPPPVAPVASPAPVASSSNEPRTCTICMDAPLDCVLLNCGHVATCMACSGQLQTCPLCRQPIARVNPIFMA